MSLRLSWLLLVGQLVVLSGPARPLPPPAEVPADVTAESCSKAHVQAAIDAAATDDIVAVPSGSCAWDGQVLITKAITLRGAGVGSTVILDDAPDQLLLNVQLVADKTTRITGFEFGDGGKTCAVAVACYGIRFQATNTATPSTGRFRFDHNKIDHLTTTGGSLITFILVDKAYGVIDNNELLTSGNRIPIYFFTGSGYTYSDARWAGSTNWGGEDFLFIEDNIITYDSGSHYACLDAYAGARIVFRYNTATRCWVEAHGTESTGRARGTRAIEVYGNTFTANDGGSLLVHLRSGTALVYDNVATGYGAGPVAVRLNNERTFYPFGPWGITDGRNLWDVNDAGNPFETGTATSAGTLTVTDSSQAWDTNEWAGRTIHKTSAPCYAPIGAVDVDTDRITVTGHGLSTGQAVQVVNHIGSTPHIGGVYSVTVLDANTITIGVNITSAGSGGYLTRVGSGVPACAATVASNTGTQLTFTSDGGFPSLDLTFAEGDTFELMLISDVLDAPGRSGGTSLAGVTNPPLPSGVVYNQSDDPVYVWDNTEDGNAIGVVVSQSLQIRSGEHYFTTEAPGYTPYTYPHPLRGGS
jgi:hypothetical protein